MHFLKMHQYAYFVTDAGFMVVVLGFGVVVNISSEQTKLSLLHFNTSACRLGRLAGPLAGLLASRRLLRCWQAGAKFAGLQVIELFVGDRRTTFSWTREMQGLI